MTPTAEQRHRIAEQLARKNRGLLTWLGFGFVAILAITFMAFERTTVPSGDAANAAVEQLLQPAGENRVYNLDGKARMERNIAPTGDVKCRVHTDRQGDRAYDYDCVATVTDAKGCRGFVPFYIETSSIGRISRPVSDSSAAAILQSIQLPTVTDCST